jgi:hypothetical protein
MENLDRQMQLFSTRLQNDLKIKPVASEQLATTIAREVAALSEDSKQRNKNSRGRASEYLHHLIPEQALLATNI